MPSGLKLVVGLGNPGEKYAKTRHNVGWMVIDEVAKRLVSQGIAVDDWRSETSFEADIAQVRSADTRFLIKPTPFMNNSGRSVAQFARYHKFAPEEILVLHDELDLPFGSVRSRLGGSAAGHHGIESVQYHLGTDQFWRLRLGIQAEHADTATNFVLSAFADEEHVVLRGLIDRSADFVVRSLLNEPLVETTFTVSS